MAADDGTHRGFNPGPGNRIHPREGLLPVRASPALLGVVCGPERTAAGIPAKRNPRKSEKGTKGERNEEEVGVAVIHDDGSLLRTRRADSNGDRASRLVNASPRFENQRPRSLLRNSRLSRMYLHNIILSSNNADFMH